MFTDAEIREAYEELQRRIMLRVIAKEEHEEAKFNHKMGESLLLVKGVEGKNAEQRKGNLVLMLAEKVEEVHDTEMQYERAKAQYDIAYRRVKMIQEIHNAESIRLGESVLSYRLSILDGGEDES